MNIEDDESDYVCVKVWADDRRIEFSSAHGTRVTVDVDDGEETMFIAVSRPDDDEITERVAEIDVRECARTLAACITRAALPPGIRRRLVLWLLGA